MVKEQLANVVQTIPEKCRRCYGCVRECPARAIKVEGGQARVIPERCISCGNCYKACTQKAKLVLDGKGPVRRILNDASAPSVALLAPSFPATCLDFHPDRLVGALRELGFQFVCEVAFGADLNSRLYHRLRKESPVRPVITTTCPAVVSLIQKYTPKLVPNLAPIVSPMVAMARVARAIWGGGARTVFIGPCIGKKMEAHGPEMEGEVGECLTFQELWQMFEESGIDPAACEPGEFDGPRAGLGQLFPVQDGLLRSADIRESPLDAAIVAANGKRRCIWVLEDLARERFNADFIDLLMCEGCINGPAMVVHNNLIWRKQRVMEYARERARRLDVSDWENSVTDWLQRVGLGRGFKPYPVLLDPVSPEEIRRTLAKMGKPRPEDELNCGACGYGTCRDKAEAVHRGLAEVEMCLPFLVENMERTCVQLRETNRLLQNAQESLIQSEKLASMGQLAAGVAHEINNPLGSILMFSHLLLDSMGGGSEYREDVELIVKEAHRCKTIVAGLLNFARQSKVFTQVVDTGAFLDEIVRQKKMDKKFESVTFHVEVGSNVDHVWLDADQFRQVLENLIHNAVEAMEGAGEIFLRARMAANGRDIVFEVEDTGKGIPKENLNRVFTPFFTTKKIGKGTGLGLAIVYGIMKMHGGTAEVISEEGKGACFRLTLPKREMGDSSVEAI